MIWPDPPESDLAVPVASIFRGAFISRGVPAIAGGARAIDPLARSRVRLEARRLRACLGVPRELEARLGLGLCLSFDLSLRLDLAWVGLWWALMVVLPLRFE